MKQDKPKRKTWEEWAEVNVYKAGKEFYHADVWQCFHAHDDYIEYLEVLKNDYKKCFEQLFKENKELRARLKGFQEVENLQEENVSKLEARIVKLEADICDVSLVSDMRHRETITKLKIALEYYEKKRNLGTLSKTMVKEYWVETGETARTALKECGFMEDK